MTDLFGALSRADYSRFHQKGSASYCLENGEHFPYATDPDGMTYYDISSTARQHGVQTKLVVTQAVYEKWVHNPSMLPTRNIATLCHAFLYAVDLDVDESAILEFSAKYFNGNKGYQMIKFRARLRNIRHVDYIQIELPKE